MDYQKIVLGYDESEAAKLALERATAIATARSSASLAAPDSS